jgi:hypothetical protein
MERFRGGRLPWGIDLGRSQFDDNFGHWMADSTTTFTSGMLLQLNSNGEVVRSVGTEPFGWARMNKTSSLYAAVWGERIQLTGTTATTLANTNLRAAAGGVAGVLVSSAINGGTTYTEGAGSDYVVNYTNGTVTRTAGSTIGSGAYVYVSYQYLIPTTQLRFEGKNFYNHFDEVTQNGRKVSICTGPGLVFTTMFDPAQTYAVNDALTAGTTAEVLEGYVTKGGAGAFIGNVFQVPTAADPFMGIKYIGGMLS